MQTGCTRAINMLPLRWINRGRSNLTIMKAQQCGSAQHPKPDIVVTVVGIVVVAVRRTHVVRCIVPGAAANNTTIQFRGTRQALNSRLLFEYAKKLRPPQAVVSPLTPALSPRWGEGETVIQWSAIQCSDGGAHNTRNPTLL